MGGDIFHIIDFNMAKFMNSDDKYKGEEIKSINDTISNTMNIKNSSSVSIFPSKNIGLQSNKKFDDNSDVYAYINNDRGLLVIHPDMLISPTKIAEAIGCVRRGVISERVKSLRGGFNKSAVLGNLRHSFIEVTHMTFV